MGNVSAVRVRKTEINFDLALKICAAVVAVCTLLLTLTVSDYYIFNRFAEYGFFFCLSQWVKKAGVILIALAAFFNCRSCADAAKYFLPVFIILSCCLYGDFFDAEVYVAEGDINGEIFKSLNTFFPKSLNIALFFIDNVFMAMCCSLLFLRDGYKINRKSLWGIPLSMIAATPLNIFENFFNIDDIPKDSFFRFYNFTLWHFLAIAVLFGSTAAVYFFLRNKTRVRQDKYLAALAVTLLLQYHSKDSVVLGDGYNVYNTIFACIPLFICNIGVYVASISVILKRKTLYSISFFIHAAGALSVFVYFGKDSMSDFGIAISYSILYFCLTHCILFILCVIPSALGHYKFRIKDCIIPLVYYFIVIVIAALASAAISAVSTTWTTADGQHLVYDGLVVSGSIDGLNELGSAGYMRPNYAFTQVNPLPFEVPDLIPLGGFLRYINLVYVLLLYLVYVAMFFAFYGLHAGYLAILLIIKRKSSARTAGISGPEADKKIPQTPLCEAAATDGEEDKKENQRYGK